MTRLRIATFNLENLDDRPDVRPSLADRITFLQPQLLRLEADLVCLQEVNAQQAAPHQSRTLAALDRLLEGTPYADYARVFTGSPSGEGPADRHNLVVLSRFTIEASRQIHHELVPPLSYMPSMARPPAIAPMELSWDRPILYTTIHLPKDQHLHLLNLHLKAPLAVAIQGQKLSAESWRSMSGWAEGFFVASIKRAGQALEARLLIDRLLDAEPNALIAVCGDFNADDGEVPVRIIRGGIEDHVGEAENMRELIALEQRVPLARRYSVLHAERPVMLDHVLVSRALAAWARRIEIHNETLRDEAAGPATDSPILGSYHAPVIAEFIIPA